MTEEVVAGETPGQTIGEDADATDASATGPALKVFPHRVDKIVFHILIK